MPPISSARRPCILSARDILTDPVRIVQGEVGEANQDVTQIVHILPNGSSKWTWLLSKLVEFTVGQCHAVLIRS